MAFLIEFYTLYLYFFYFFSFLSSALWGILFNKR